MTIDSQFRITYPLFRIPLVALAVVAAVLVSTPAPAQSADTSRRIPVDGSPVAPAPPQPTAPPKNPTLDELLLFFPAKFPQGNWKPTGLDFHDEWFQADDGTRLHGWYCPCEKPRAVVLYFHGNGGNLSYDSPLMIHFQKSLRVHSLVFDYRGYGRSEGVPTVEGVLKDARAARALLARVAGVKESQIVLMGRSLGGAVAVQLAAEVAPRGLVLERTFSSLRDMASYHCPAFAWVVSQNKLNSAAKLARYQGPLLQSHGDADTVVPYASGVALFRAAPGPQKTFLRIPRANHNDPSPAEYYRQLDDFIGNLPSS